MWLGGWMQRLVIGTVIVAAAYVGAAVALTGSARMWAFVALAMPAIWLFMAYVRIIEAPGGKPHPAEDAFP
jgi:hypothetical protein